MVLVFFVLSLLYVLSVFLCIYSMFFFKSYLFMFDTLVDFFFLWDFTESCPIETIQKGADCGFVLFDVLLSLGSAKNGNYRAR